MAEGKAGGAAGLFAKQVQKKFSRAQEKVCGRVPPPAWPAGLALRESGVAVGGPGGLGRTEGSQADGNGSGISLSYKDLLENGENCPFVGKDREAGETVSVGNPKQLSGDPGKVGEGNQHGQILPWQCSQGGLLQTLKLKVARGDSPQSQGSADQLCCR